MVYPEPVAQLVDAAVQRILSDMRQGGPTLAHQAERWMKGLAGTEQPADYFKHPLAFPMLLLPWWMEQTVHADPDMAFQANLVYSSVNGYYFIRMVDNVMDGHGVMDRHGMVEQKLLPMLGFFHMQFHSVYQLYFSHDHPFWPLFRAVSIHSAESAVRDAALREVDWQAFVEIAGQKVAGGKIPLAAVAYRYNRPHLYEPWRLFYDKLGCWHQMYNDLFGWLKDLHTQTPSYFLSEGRRRKPAEQSLGAWVVQEGFAWGAGVLEEWLSELIQQAGTLHSQALLAYLQFRQAYLREQVRIVASGLQKLERVLQSSELVPLAPNAPNDEP